MIVKSIKSEYINLSTITVFTFRESTLCITEDGRKKVYTLTEESRREVEKHLEKVK
jgi:hypothetical protein